MPDKAILRQFQAMPLRVKILKSQLRIREWYDHFGGDVCVSFSGGKDSTVLAHLVHEIYPDVPLVFANTGLEYPEIQAFARKMGAEFVRPKMSFSEVISTYGYPIISKENAEAIYYARRIRNGGGTSRLCGGGETLQAIPVHGGVSQVGGTGKASRKDNERPNSFRGNSEGFQRSVCKAGIQEVSQRNGNYPNSGRGGGYSYNRP